MKRIVITLGLLSLLCVADAAQTVEKPYYVSLKIGGTMPRDSKATQGSLQGEFTFENAVNLSVAVGMRLQPTLRLELEGSYRKVDIDKAIVAGVGTVAVTGDAETKTLMTNIYYDVPVRSQLHLSAFGSPYVMGGIGVARTDATEDLPGFSTWKGRDTVFAYQAGIGSAFEMSETVVMDVGYRYLGSKDLRFEGRPGTSNIQIGYGVHEILAGLRFVF